VRTVVHCELGDRAIGEPCWKLQDVSDHCPPEAIQALILIADDAEVARPLRQLEQELLLNVVGILVFVHEDVANVVSERVPLLGICEEGMDLTL
jgi:hypothetical protein